MNVREGEVREQDKLGLLILATMSDSEWRNKKRSRRRNRRRNNRRNRKKFDMKRKFF